MPLVAVVTDGTTGFGRSIARGAMRYINLQRRWLIYRALGPQRVPKEGWPHFDGAIVAGIRSTLPEHIKRTCGNVVVCSGSADAKMHPVASLDDYAVGVMAAEHLLECRLQHFAFYGLSPNQLSQRRFRGFSDALEAKGFQCMDVGLRWLTVGQLLKRGLLPSLIQWLQKVEKPVGIMAIDDTAGNELAMACFQAKVSVPDHVAIVSVNNDDLLCESTWPPISSVDGDYSRVGFGAAAMLDRMLAGEKLTGDERVLRLSPLRVVRRQSTDMLAIDDPNVRDAVRFIREHACDPCHVNDVVRHIPVTRRWLERHFASVIGHGIYDEILRVRIEVAKRLLIDPSIKLESVSDRCGFSMIEQFRRAFARATGSPPGAFRKAHMPFTTLP